MSNAINNISIRIKRKINLSSISQAKLRKTSLHHSGSEHVSKPISFKNSLFSLPKSEHDSSSPTMPRFRDPSYYKTLINIEDTLAKNKDLDLKDQYEFICIFFEDLLKINPELTTILNSIQKITSDYLETITKSAEENHKQANEDFKRLSKRYKKMALEVMELQEKLKKKKKIVYELKIVRNESAEDTKVKNNRILELESQINMLKIKNQRLSDLQFCSQPVKACKTLTISIPEKSNLLLPPGQESALLSSIDLVGDLDPTPTHNEMELLLSSIEKDDKISPGVDDKISPGINELLNNLDKTNQ